ncbi:hypothetical protein VTI28DRAFT_10530 [Corynascus sepedonium]
MLARSHVVRAGNNQSSERNTFQEPRGASFAQRGTLVPRHNILHMLKRLRLEAAQVQRKPSRLETSEYELRWLHLCGTHLVYVFRND